MAFDDGYYFGMCKVIVTSSKIYDEGKTISVTDGENSYTGTLSSGKVEFDVPNRNMYTITMLNGEVAEYTTKVCLGYGECVNVSLEEGNEPVYKSMVDTYSKSIASQGDTTKKIASVQAMLGLGIRYNQENGYVQLYSNGQWRNFMPGGFKALDLYTGANQGEFVPFGINEPSITFNGSMRISATANATDDSGFAISRKVNVSEFDTLSFGYEASTGTSGTQFVKAYLSQTKEIGMLPVQSTTLASGTSASASGTRVIDVSALHGEFYIVFEVARGTDSGSFANLVVSDLKLTAN